MMDKIKESLANLLNTFVKEEQIKMLQEINRLLLTEYMLEISENFRVYPIEVETYYYNEKSFPDTCVHKNDLQKKRFGKLYFHRASSMKEDSFLYDRGGFDVCLSDNDNYFLGILIRSAWINCEEKPICGPGLLTRRVIKHISQNDKIINLTDDEKSLIRTLEDKDSILVYASDDKRKKDSPLFHSTRFGISSDTHPEYAQYKLRSLIELKEANHPFKEKEKVVESYMRDNNILPTEKNTKQILGYVSKSIINKLQNG